MSRRAQTQRKMAHKLRKTGTSRRPHPHPVSISTLPFEILAYIFIVIRNTATSQSHWVRLAWVCGYWRAVALQTHLLWTNLSFSHLRDLDFVAILLRRADGLDLELTVDTTTSDIPMAIAPFLDHLHQLRSLSLTFLHDQTQAVQDTLNISLPRLVTLAVRAVYPAGTEDDAEGGVAQLFIDPTAIPALRNLHITSLRIDAPQSVFSGLVGLELSRIQGERFSPLIDWVIDILEACGPTLQHLTIRSVEYWGTIWVGTQHLPRSLLPFPRLRTLKMRGTAPGYSSSLARFRLPDTTSFDLSLLWTYVDDRWAAFTDVLFPYRRADRDAALPILLRTRRLCVQAGKSFYLTGRAENTEEPLWTATANLKDLPRQGSIDMFPNMIVDLSSLLQRDSVVEYECHFAPYFPTYEPWPRIIGAFRDIRKFTFGGTRTVKEALEELVGCRAGLPNLQEMTLCIPEVADSTVKALVECKKLKLRRGEAVIPGVVTFRLPQRLAQCRATRATIEKLRIRLVRFIRLEVCYLDCDFCQQLPKRVPPRRSLRAQGEEVDNTPAHSTLSVDGLD
ncbi:hypothetical protein BV20DRAFT_153969 [Pilatotrama ljubarskyi]|nr:hypothetical protein BV20DRAFT_153969 [Pilatotrama ljubarskyi]